MLGRRLTPDSTGPPSEVMLSYGVLAETLRRRPVGIGPDADDRQPERREPASAQSLLQDRGCHAARARLGAGRALDAHDLRSEPGEAPGTSRFLFVYGRLRAGATVAGADSSELTVIAGRIAAANPITNHDWTARAVPLPDQLVGPVRPALVMLLAAAACVLLIGAANLANLFLVRCLARQRELALRAALGAQRGRLVRELVAEAGLLSVMAGALESALPWRACVCCGPLHRPLCRG